MKGQKGKKKDYRYRGDNSKRTPPSRRCNTETGRKSEAVNTKRKKKEKRTE